MIESIEDAQEYKEEVVKRLISLAKLSEEAGINTVAATFYGISAMFLQSPEKVTILSDFVQIQTELALEEANLLR